MVGISSSTSRSSSIHKLLLPEWLLFTSVPVCYCLSTITVYADCDCRHHLSHLTLRLMFHSLLPHDVPNEHLAYSMLMTVHMLLSNSKVVKWPFWTLETD